VLTANNGFIDPDSDEAEALIAEQMRFGAPPEQSEPPGWPVLDDKAFHGFPGTIVADLSPETEADPAGLLAALLTMAGAAIGARPHAIADSAAHPARLFTVLVGLTAGGRKGTVSAVTKRVMRVAAPDFMANCVLGGFGSGEILVDAVRDPTDDDPGSPDRRLLVHEAELARVFRVANREGSTLSTTIRAAWDGERLEARSRQRTSVASDASVAMLGHITPDELRKHLNETEIAAGLGNRMLFIAVRRSQLLPEGGDLDDELINDIGQELAKRIARARTFDVVKRSTLARAVWAKMYQQFDEDERPGLVGALTARAPAQVLRLSVAYALLDGRREVEPRHLEAAAALWDYSVATVEYVFGDTVGDGIADRILEAARREPNGIDGTDIRDLFKRHATRAQIEAARDLLESRGLIKIVKTPARGGAGRDRTVIYAVATEATKATERRDRSLPSQKSQRNGEHVQDVSPDWYQDEGGGWRCRGVF
jgi:hypothetical protein